ncbi:inositol-pentakisphosphate 2-kinase-like isoform X1 [Achroia grisella]|uniref:inositol-pentakisphosphate 2-kinase-like isoform X1 n=1 Tax=Achroia grisella TaxID=688607 RepID=UPI0027D29E6C|nr:inositol-pentakisphosphate 2-kinase-like isoform X1 [Achroia grisella]
MNNLRDSWKYIGEGNAHIVIEILNTNYVLRLKKEHGKRFDLDRMQESVDFVNMVMSPLLFGGNDILNQIVQIPAEQLKELTEKLYDIRPEHRRYKSTLNCFAIKSINLTMIDPHSVTNYCIEIKPKEGYITSSFKNISKCYYCLKQCLKHEEGQINNTSRYCPLDLFSADQTRMRNALLNLIDNPQNNFKLFLNGNIIYNDKSARTDFDTILRNMLVFDSSLELFLSFIIEILLGNKNIVANDANKAVQENTKMEYCVENSKMEPGAILYKLLHLQKLSEDKQTYSNIDSDDFEYVKSILDLLKVNALDLSVEEDREKFFSMCESVHLGMISAVAKDCSIMLSFTPNYDNNYPYIEIGGQKISYRLSITDLEPKSTKTLLKRKVTERKLLDLYKNMEPKRDS